MAGNFRKRAKKRLIEYETQKIIHSGKKSKTKYFSPAVRERRFKNWTSSGKKEEEKQLFKRKECVEVVWE